MVLADQRLIERDNKFTEFFDGRAACLIFGLDQIEKLKALISAKATVEQTLDGGAPEHVPEVLWDGAKGLDITRFMSVPCHHLRPSSSERVRQGARSWRGVMRGNHAERISVPEVEIAELSLAEPPRILQDRLEHRLQFAGRARNDLQHLGGGGLLCQRLA
jgi:hypothetical protein